MGAKVRIDGVSFGTLPELCLFLLVKTDGKEIGHMDRTIYQKCSWGSFNAVRQNIRREAPDRGFISVGKEQLVIPLE